MSLNIKNADGTLTRWRGESISDVKHPLSIERLWTAAELAEIGLEIATDPVAVEDNTLPPPRVVCDFIEFIGLFDGAEQLAIAEAAMTIPALKLWYDQAVATNRIELTSEKVTAGVASLVTAGLLTSARASSVLASTFEPKRGV